MDTEIIEAILKAALPLGLLSYLLFRWSLKAGRLGGAEDKKAFKAEMKAMKKSARPKQGRSRNPLHNKWMKFGGGFYGLVGLWTFLVVETKEVYGFVTGYQGMDTLVQSLTAASPLNLVIKFFVNSLQNFIAAVAWPGYWPGVLESERLWLWVFAAYGGYWIGMRAARARVQTNRGAGAA